MIIIGDISVESRPVVRIALLASIVAALGMVPGLVLPLARGVPITAQTLGVMLAGIILGPRHGALAVLLFLLVVLVGAPLLSGGRGGLGVLLGRRPASCWPLRQRHSCPVLLWPS